MHNVSKFTLAVTYVDPEKLCLWIETIRERKKDEAEVNEGEIELKTITRFMFLSISNEMILQHWMFGMMAMRRKCMLLSAFIGPLRISRLHSFYLFAYSGTKGRREDERFTLIQIPHVDARKS